MTLVEFLEVARKRPYNYNAWIKYPEFSGLYLRYGKRRLDSKVVEDVLDIATVDVENPGQGVFKRFIAYLREHHPELTLYVENAHPRFGEGLVRLGFTRIEDSYSLPEISSSYYSLARPQQRKG